MATSTKLATVPPFHKVPQEELTRLADRAVARNFDPGESFFLEGEPCHGLWLITGGSAKIVKTTPSGRQMTLTVSQAPSLIAEVPVFDGGPYPASVFAVEPCEAFLLLREELLTTCRRHPDLALQFLSAFGARLRHLVVLMERITFGSVRQRLAQILLDFSSASDVFQLAETQEELASRLGTVREVVSRNLARFQAEGYIQMQRREVRILSRAQLESEARSEL